MSALLSASDFVAVRAAMAGAHAAQRAFGQGRRTSIRKDSDDMLCADGTSDASPLTYHLHYRDAEGEESARVVTLRRIDPDRSGLKLICWCHAAGAIRCFSTRGIVEVFDVVTGEVHDEPDAFFSNHPMLTDPRDPEGYALRVCRHEVNVLIAVGAADGRFDPEEQDRVIMHVFDRLPELQMDENLVRQRLCRLTPDVGAFEAAMLQMGRLRRGDPGALMRSLRRLVDADGQITREEVVFVEEVRRHLEKLVG